MCMRLRRQDGGIQVWNFGRTNASHGGWRCDSQRDGQADDERSMDDVGSALEGIG